MWILHDTTMLIIINHRHAEVSLWPFIFIKFMRQPRCFQIKAALSYLIRKRENKLLHKAERISSVIYLKFRCIVARCWEGRLENGYIEIAKNTCYRGSSKYKSRFGVHTFAFVSCETASLDVLFGNVAVGELFIKFLLGTLAVLAVFAVFFWE